MKPHLYLHTNPWGTFKEWLCVERMPAVQRGVLGHIATYVGSGESPKEAYDKCQKVKCDRTQGLAK